ncbi:nuclear transport factor 2 family protein [Nocardia sp. NBC_00881]|uniref:nuclear transport factor 2 family protein n=1 Tax=Nocardia sp. NBC_00881 TaxID=2975995 RepID=UPI00386E2248|nr:nuclear transport factor 2 family protein [Nocardia sp. NBC_00881]
MSYVIEDYYATVDSGRLRAAVSLLAEDVEFAMILPTGVNRGRGRSAMLDYLSGRPEVTRKHRLLRVAADGDVQFAHGAVTEHDAVTTGYFVGVMHIGLDGRIDRYQVSFSADFALLPTQSTSKGARQ